ncbi:hypothetical protein PQY76_00710 [bacterium]|nr:hypothetical protein [bacterium]
MASSLSSSRLLSSRPEPGSRRRRGDDATVLGMFRHFVLLLQGEAREKNYLFFISK